MLQQILLIVIAVSWGFTVRAIWHWRVLDRIFGPSEGRPLTQRRQARQRPLNGAERPAGAARRRDRRRAARPRKRDR